MKRFELWACKTSDWFKHPIAILGVWIISGVWIRSGLEETALTLTLSIAALTLTQLVLVSQGRTERAIQRKLDELVKAVPDADDAVAGDP